ncbi:putative glucose oxidase protein [Neofusicoccum parvum UCRNP2]|uniref:Putative glucose oxidase protein n=1 Tax=Botryosphaeria parva (strain UCR-NP2) TaxID=1287680 RepID=R1EQF5_BOTPV|nr:putative glucose oxidase protein [Neofusicoccum parvum UCRNP2]
MVRSYFATLSLLTASTVALPTTAEDRFDYVIVGGGTSGLVVAHRLSELADVTVAVIEAGDSVYDNPNVTNVDGFGLALGTQIDWAYESAPQTYANGKSQTLRAAKALGGSSTINGMYYARAQNVQVDSWGALGNEGWSWEELLPYYKKSEHIQPPTSEQQAVGITYLPEFHGTDGPLAVGWKVDMMNKTITDIINKTHEAIGVSYNPDLAHGDMVGWAFGEHTQDNQLNVREDAARAYYWPFTDRKNYHLFVNTEAQKLVWAETASGADAKASGVLVTDSKSGESRTIYANKEVILSAGAVRTPVLLELSGVGNPSILKAAGIDVKIDLPTVGENLQDQALNSFNGESAKPLTGRSSYVAYPNYEQIFGDDAATVAGELKSNLQAYAQATSESTKGVVTTAQLEKFFQIQYDHIFTDKIPVGEALLLPADSSFSNSYWGLLPFARGSVHVTGTTGEYPAKLDPNYFMLDFDTKLQVAMTKYMRKYHNTAPLGELFAAETTPGLEAVPAEAEDETWTKWVHENYRSNFHSVGTTAMMSRELGGVVDSHLRLYGASNVRVVDAGVIPLQICGHLVGTLYAVAEKASDLIKADV